VVIPTHDTRELTLSCLASLAAARPAPTEVIVVDDGSRDGTADAVAASYPAVRLLRHQQPRGFTAAANAGAALARGDLLLLLNSDTEVAPDALAALHEAFAADPRLGVAGAALYYPDGRPQWSGGAAPTALWLLALASGVAFRLGAWAPWRRLRPVSGHGGRRSVAWVTGAALCIRREAWAAAGPLDPRFALYAQDLDLCLQARRLGWEVAVVPESRVVHHHGASVGGVAGVTGARHNPAMLWSDLVRAATKHRGPAGGRRTAALLRVGGAVRRGLLGLAALGGGEARRGAADERRLLREAAAAAATAAAHPRESLPAGAERSTTR
jgi:GT2 family glycosyltransferase